MKELPYGKLEYDLYIKKGNPYRELDNIIQRKKKIPIGSWMMILLKCIVCLTANEKKYIKEESLSANWMMKILSN